MRKVNDRGGLPTEGPIDRGEHELTDWERRVDALSQLIGARGKGIRRVDESRRAIESIDPEQYELMGYYDRWLVSLETGLVEKNILTKEEIDRKTAELKQRWE